MKIYLILASLLICSSLFAQNKEDLSKIKSLESEIIPLNLNENSEFIQNKKKLKQYIADASIVLLGEESHGDGTAFMTKSELVKFLHQELGFNVIAFESSMYLAEKSFQNIQNKEDAKLELRRSITPLWGWAVEVQPLINYIDEQKQSTHPLIVSGFDHQEISQTDRETFPFELYNSMEKENINFKDQEEQNAFFKFYALLSSQFYGKNENLTLDSLNYLLSTFNNAGARILADLEKLEGKDMELLTQSMRNKLAVSSNAVYRKYNDSRFNEYTRDSIMAENIIWLKEKRYPNKKIIIWAANLHNARNAGSPYKTTMGDYIYRKYKDELYSIGFVANKGEMGTIQMQNSRSIEPAKENTLEYLFSKTEVPNFFLDFKTFKNTKKGKWLNNDLDMRPFGYMEQNKNWTDIFDAVIFNNEMGRVNLFKVK